MTGDPPRHLSLVSHTNVGKTTLVRTLLRQRHRRGRGPAARHRRGREARADRHAARATRLRLWDTPGFGDSARLLKRLRASGEPDRLVPHPGVGPLHRPAFLLQPAGDPQCDASESDVVLYLVNAAEEPAAAGYVENGAARSSAGSASRWCVLLNQMGPRARREAEAVEEAALEPAPRRPSRVDARAIGARCLRALLGAGGPAARRRRRCARRGRSARRSSGCARAWRARNLAAFDAAMRSIAMPARRAPPSTVKRGRARASARSARRWFASLVRDGDKPDPVTERAMNMLARRLDQAVRENTDRLIALHGFVGSRARWGSRATRRPVQGGPAAGCRRLRRGGRHRERRARRPRRGPCLGRAHRRRGRAHRRHPRRARRARRGARVQPGARR